MKRKLQIFINASAASFLAFAAQAQESPNPKPQETRYTHESMDHARADRLNGAAKASDVIGMTVKNYQNEKLGKVDDLAVDVESGRIVQVILSIGGFLGIGDSLAAVPPGVLHYDVPNKVIHLDASKEKLKTAPKFDTSKWDESTQSNLVTEVYVYYGEQPYFIAGGHGQWITNRDGTIARTMPLHMDGTINTDAPRTVEKVRNAEQAATIEETTNVLSTRSPGGTWVGERYANENRGKASWSRLGYIQKASKLMGSSVKNLQDEKLGKVENLMVDLSAGRIVAVIISTGGFLGMGDELSAVPPTTLRFNSEHDTLQLDASKEMLVSSPHFKPSDWPDLGQPSYAGEVYRAYKVEPYFFTGMTDAATDADNTRLNVRDRDNQTMTPLDQGSSQADRNLSAQIRKEILADKTMSVNARNVKIITKNGQVTLRGPVSNADERRRIEAIANRISQSGNVNNQLEVTHSDSTSSNN